MCSYHFSQVLTMGVNFLPYRKSSNHAVLRECQKHKIELSLKVTFMRLYNTKSAKKVHFSISGIAESQQK